MHTKKRVPLILLVFALLSLCCGCGRGQDVQIGTAQVIEIKTGSKKIRADGCWADYSNVNQGYVVVNSGNSEDTILFETVGPDGTPYRYYVSPEEGNTAVPLTTGNGEYEIKAYRYLSGNEYLTILDGMFTVKLKNEFLPYLCPNQYVNFDGESEVVRLAGELTEGCETQLEKLKVLYGYVTENIQYDYELAETVESGYLPDPDETIRTGKGICIDFASLTCAMLRCQGIPAKLQIGETGDGTSHAWCEVYLEESGMLDDVTEVTENGWTIIDPTQMSVADSRDARLLFMSRCESYTLEYSR